MAKLKIERPWWWSCQWKNNALSIHTFPLAEWPVACASTQSSACWYVNKCTPELQCHFTRGSSLDICCWWLRRYLSEVCDDVSGMKGRKFSTNYKGKDLFSWGEEQPNNLSGFVSGKLVTVADVRNRECKKWGNVIVWLEEGISSVQTLCRRTCCGEILLKVQSTTWAYPPFRQICSWTWYSCPLTRPIFAC